MTDTLPAYLEAHPETVIAFAYFDMDSYEPTKVCLELIQPFLAQGSILGFDEVNASRWTRETVALKEVLGLRFSALQGVPYHPHYSYMIVD